jgi:hypothetical protein
MVSMLSVEPRADCANGRRRLRISSKELTCPHHLRSFFCFLVRNAFTPLWKRSVLARNLGETSHPEADI